MDSSYLDFLDSQIENGHFEKALMVLDELADCWLDNSEKRRQHAKDMKRIVKSLREKLA